MGDEQGTRGAELGAGEERRCILDHGAHELMELRVVDGEGEQRGHGGDYGLRYQSAWSSRELLEAAGTDAAHGHGDEVVVAELVEGFYVMAGADVDTEAAGFAQEAVDDGLGVLRGGEDTMVRLDGQANAMLLEPIHGVVLRESFQQPFHQPVASRIDFCEVAHVLEGVCAVAASASGDLDFSEDVLAALEDGDFHLRAQFLEVDGEEKTCGSTADDGCSHFRNAKARHSPSARVAVKVRPRLVARSTSG